MEPQKTPSTAPSDNQKSEGAANAPAEDTDLHIELPEDTNSEPKAPAPAVQVEAEESPVVPAASADESSEALPKVAADTTESSPPAAASEASTGEDAAVDVDAAAAEPEETPAIVATPLPVSQPKSRKRLMMAGLIVAAVLVVLGGGASAAYYYMLNQPGNVLKQALANALDDKKSKTVQFSGALTVAQSAGMSVPLTAAFTGKADSQSGAFSLDGSLDVAVAKITLGVRSADGKTMYLKVGGLDGLPELLAASGSSASAYASLITALNGQWLELSQSLVSQYSHGATGAEKLSDADRQKLVDAYQKNDFIQITKTLPSESIGGTNSYHYQLGVDKAKLKSFAAALKSSNISGLSFTQAQLTEFNKSVDSAKMNDFPVEVWIGKSSKMFTQVMIKAADAGKPVTTMRLTVDSYNQPVTVEKPAGAKSIMDVLGAYLSQQAGAGMAPGLGGISL